MIEVGHDLVVLRSIWKAVSTTIRAKLSPKKA